MKNFSRVAKDVYLLKVPFGPVWTGVVLLRGEKNILIDSSATGKDVDDYVMPALQDLGLEMTDIHYLVNTHSHGDHIGGHDRLRELGDFQVASFVGSKPKLEDPVPYAIVTRTKFLPYCAAKGGLEMFTKALAVKVAKYGIRGNCVAPGFIMTKLSDRYKPEDLEAGGLPVEVMTTAGCQKG